QAGIAMTPSKQGLEFLASAMPMASASVDRLDQVPGRLSFLFTYDADAALRDAGVLSEMSGEAARAVVAALAAELAAAPRLDREQFRAIANLVKGRTGHKGQA